jgi:ribonucleoside-diphosphate reductase alpha chain
MAVLRVDHPDIEDFITCKTDENAINNFNISVGIPDGFMQAVENDETWNLRFPDVISPKYHGFQGSLERAESIGIPIRVYDTVRARDLFNKIVQQAHHNGEPGVLFLDTANRQNPVPHLYDLEATNPCGEQWLGPYENCCLGSINLAQFGGSEGSVDWDNLQKSVETATRFLDNVVEANAYVPSVPQLKNAAHNARRIGLGIMGLSDLMYHCGIRYGSQDGQEFAAQVMEFIRFHTMNTSIQLAKERGQFPSIEGSIYDPDDIKWTPPKPVVPYQRNWNRPVVDWNEILKGIQKNGIRNAAQTTVAPTGTIATVAGCEGYGCEPVFALAYVRHVDDNGKDLQLIYTSPLFEKALGESGIDDETREIIIEQVLEMGSCQNISEVPAHLRDIFVVSQDISAEEHVRMQAALQSFVDNSLSKTVNFPANAIEGDVAMVYKLAWELGCKGITVYVTGSRQSVVLETKATAQLKERMEDSTEISEEQLMIWHETKKPRPRRLKGYTYNINTPLGKTFVTVNENGGNHPFEIFISTAKAGSDTAAVSEAIGRLLSYILRLPSPVSPRERLNEIVRQLSGIGGGRPLGFGPNRVRSLPDGVSQALREYLDDSAEGTLNQDWDNGHYPEKENPISLEHPLFKVGDLCPECGQAAVVNEEGCRKCYACGFSEC